MMGLPDGVRFSAIFLPVLRQYQIVCDRHSDGQDKTNGLTNRKTEADMLRVATA